MFLQPPTEAQLEFIKKDDAWRPEEELDEHVTRLIEWLSKQPHLPDVTDRSWLSHFIIGCKYDLQRSQKVIETYFVMRAEFQEIFKPVTMEQLRENSQLGFVYCFPKLTPEGHRIVCVKTRQFNDDIKVDGMTVANISVSILDALLKVEPMYGNDFLYDLEHLKFSSLLVFTPKLTKRLISIWLNAFPLRVKSMHIVNPPHYVDGLLTFVKKFMPSKLKKRFVVHDSVADLQKYFPKDILPDAYGGTNGTLEEYEESMLKLYEANKEWLETRPKADLSKRPGRQANADELDMNGTFRQLRID